jgi:acyl-CoA dehydrogenase
MYLASAVLKHFENQGRRATDLPLVEWSVHTLMYQAQESLHAFLRNFPNRWIAAMLRFFIFPRGRTYSAPSDEVAAKVVDLVTTPGEARERLSTLAYTTLEPGNPLGLLQEALELTGEVAPLEKRLRQARKEGLIQSGYLGLQIEEGEKAQVISKAESRTLRNYHEKVLALLDVDDFSSDELARVPRDTAPVSKKATRKPAKRAAKKKPAAAKRSASKSTKKS